MDAHHREYAAAAEGLHEQTVSEALTRLVDGRLRTFYAVGDRVKWVEDDRELCGVVVDVLQDGTYHIRRHVPDHGNVHHIVDGDCLLPF